MEKQALRTGQDELECCFAIPVGNHFRNLCSQHMGLIRTTIVTTEFACLATALVSILFTDSKNRVRRAQLEMHTRSIPCHFACLSELCMNRRYFVNSSGDSDLRYLYCKKQQLKFYEGVYMIFHIR